MIFTFIINRYNVRVGFFFYLLFSNSISIVHKINNLREPRIAAASGKKKRSANPKSRALIQFEK